MRSFILATMITITPITMMSGCAGLGGVKTGTAEVYQRMGFITATKDMKVEGENKDMFTTAGAIVGAGVGSLFGENAGKTIATLGGGIAGGAVGTMVSKEDGQKLTVQLEDHHIVQITKAIKDDHKFERGDYVLVTFDGKGQATDLEFMDNETIDRLVAEKKPIVNEREKIVKVTVEKKVVVEKKVYVPAKSSSTTKTVSKAEKNENTPAQVPAKVTQKQPAQATKNPMDFFNN